MPLLSDRTLFLGIFGVGYGVWGSWSNRQTLQWIQWEIRFSIKTQSKFNQSSRQHLESTVEEVNRGGLSSHATTLGMGGSGQSSGNF